MSSAPAERVRGFLIAMCEWELDLAAKSERMTEMGEAEWKAVKESARTTLAAIYDEHLTARAKRPDRFGSRFDSLDFGTPPIFEQDVETVEKGPKAKTFYVLTKPRRNPNLRWRFTAVVDAKGTAFIDDLRGAAADPSGVLDWKRLSY
jgi:hypothetical protein